MLSSVKPEDKPKLIGLTGAIAVVFLVGGINIIRSVGGGAAAPAPATTPSASADATPGSPPTPAASGHASTPMIDGAMYVPRPRMPVDKLAILQPNFGADPFRPIVPVKSAPVVVPNPTPQIITQVPNPPFLSLNGRPGTLATVAPAPVVVPLKLTGVVAGADAIAMIGDGAGQHFLHRGDTIQGYHIIQIDEDAITLRRANAGKILRVGTDGSEIISFVPVKALPATNVAAVKTTPAAIAGSATKAVATKPIAPAGKPKAAAVHTLAPGARSQATANRGVSLVAAAAALTRPSEAAHGSAAAQTAPSASARTSEAETKGR